MMSEIPTCSVDGCEEPAAFEVLLYDEYRRVTSYPFTNRHGAQGFSKYRKL